ncbi:MAG TPA: hybrid sensor histidine kinase/response regulator [Methylomirabilota bacterium]|nr:hybrid sensor histidine kinase/response regulator [Methylomirabilota bacterium]
MQPCVLLVDDEPLITTTLKRVLRKEPYDICTANSGAEALQILARKPVDVIVSDERMPGMSGSEFLAVARQQYPDTVRIILTGQANLEAAIRAINEGAICRFLTKPCKEDDLTFAINEALRQKIQERALKAALVQEQERLHEEFQSAAQLKEAFLATLSHELYTPLHIIMGYNDLLRDGVFGSLTHEQVEITLRIAESSQALFELIEAMLNVSKLEAGQLPLCLSEVKVPELLHTIATRPRKLREKPGLRFVWSVAPDLPLLRTDPQKLEDIIECLLSNAVKFTDQGQITVDAYARNNGVEIAIADTGVGMTSSMLPVVFDLFRQGDSSMTRRHGGVGLGLYRAKRLVELLGGRIAVESEAGRGTTARVWIPTLLDK